MWIDLLVSSKIGEVKNILDTDSMGPAEKEIKDAQQLKMDNFSEKVSIKEAKVQKEALA